MVREDRSESKPADEIKMDQYGEAAKAYIRARTGPTCAAFFLGYLKPGLALLDCGCGEGTITVDLAALVAPGDVVGIDIAPGTLQHARQLAGDRGLSNMRFEVGNVYALPFPDNSFDAVLRWTPLSRQ